MRQKYIISKKGIANDLVIREFAVIGKIPNKNIGTLPITDEYDLIYQENYDSETIQFSISRGTKDLIQSLRTDNFFPIGPMVVKLAEKVTELYSSSGDGSAELIFDDMELCTGS